MPTKIDSLTSEQEALMPEWRDKWIAIGLKTGEADWETFNKAVRVAYEKAQLAHPKVIVRVQSPIVGAFAAPIASKLINDLTKKRDDAVGGAVGDAVRGAVDGAVGGAVGDAVGGAVDGAVGGAVGDAVRGAVDGAVGGAVRGAVGDAVDDAVDGAVRDAVGDGWYNRLGGQFWVGGWWRGSPSYTSFMTEICGLETTIDIQERAQSYQNICKSVCWWWPYTNFVMVCNRPSIINRDEQGRLHSETGQAIEWPDGWGFHALKGERFDKPEDVELWKKIVTQTITAEEVLNISDSDKREIAFSMLGPDEMLRGLNAKLIHTGIKGNRLYECKNFRGTGSTEYLLRMRDASTPREFIKGVDPKYCAEKLDADYLTARHYQDAEGNSLPMEDYLNMPVENEA